MSETNAKDKGDEDIVRPEAKGVACKIERSRMMKEAFLRCFDYVKQLRLNHHEQ